MPPGIGRTPISLTQPLAALSPILSMAIKYRSCCRCNAAPTRRPRSRSESRHLRNHSFSKPARKCPTCRCRSARYPAAARRETPRASSLRWCPKIGTVLAFYRREFANRNFHEETTGAAVTPDSVLLTFSSPEATAVLKLGRAYTNDHKPCAESLAGGVGCPGKNQEGQRRPVHADAEDAAKTAIAASDAKQAAAAAAEGPAEALRMLADNTVPVRFRQPRKTSTMIATKASLNSTAHRASNRWWHSIAPP